MRVGREKTSQLRKGGRCHKIHTLRVGGGEMCVVGKSGVCNADAG